MWLPYNKLKIAYVTIFLANVLWQLPERNDQRYCSNTNGNGSVEIMSIKNNYGGGGGVGEAASIQVI